VHADSRSADGNSSANRRVTKSPSESFSTIPV
jgi:hypothetical protein